MNFRPRAKEEPEINLIPFIDVLLVVLIFLMLTTTYSKFTEMQPREVVVAVSADGRYMINRQPVGSRSTEALSQALVEAAKAGKETVVIISADATATHQSVITVMEAARRVGLTQITFATQSSAQAGGK
ncbi:MAG: biopolymer transporter ExbD [Ramlibacter sp.]|nr:biopolymer transporter ExbD [Ramlibacter sp.]